MNSLRRLLNASLPPAQRRHGVGCPRFLVFSIILMFGSWDLPALAQTGNTGSDPLSIGQALIAALDGEDSEAVVDLLGADVQWIVHGPRHLIPYAGEYRGRAGVRQYLSRALRTRDLLDAGYGNILIHGELVTAVGWERGASTETGGEYFATHVRIITVQDRAVVRFEEILDSASIVEALTPADVNRGKAYYTTCLGCHGTHGEGNYGMHGPNLTVLDADYLLRQMRNYRSDDRGGKEDFYGWQMNGRARALPSDLALRDVIAFTETLPNVNAGKTIEGNVSRGQKIYSQQCAVCHGSRGEGIAGLKAPRLAGLDDWYQLQQMENYRKGMRGVANGDVGGQQMKPYAEAIEDEGALRDVVSYIATLGRAQATVFSVTPAE